MKRAILYPLPYDVMGFFTVNEDGEQVIFLNSRLSYENNKETFMHELRHAGDFGHPQNVAQLERHNK